MALGEDNEVHTILLQYRKEGGGERTNLIYSLLSFFQDISCNQKSHAPIIVAQEGLQDVNNFFKAPCAYQPNVCPFQMYLFALDPHTSTPW